MTKLKNRQAKRARDSFTAPTLGLVETLLALLASGLWPRALVSEAATA